MFPIRYDSHDTYSDVLVARGGVSSYALVPTVKEIPGQIAYVPFKPPYSALTLG